MIDREKLTELGAAVVKTPSSKTKDGSVAGVAMMLVAGLCEQFDIVINQTLMAGIAALAVIVVSHYMPNRG